MKMTFDSETGKYVPLLDTLNEWERDTLQKHWKIFFDNRYNVDSIDKIWRQADGILRVRYEDDNYWHYNREGEWW